VNGRTDEDPTEQPYRDHVLYERMFIDRAFAERAFDDHTFESEIVTDDN
jgi:hypothetical protein